MSLDECMRLAEKTKKRKKETRRAEGLIASLIGAVDDERILINLTKPLLGEFPFPTWVVYVHAYGELSRKYFYRRKSADNYFEELTQKYGLREAEG